MSTRPRPEVVAEGAFVLPRSIARALPLLALFLRLAVGLGLTDAGLAAIIAMGWSVTPAWMGASMSDPLASLEPLFRALPFLAAAAGVGLVFGIFTTASALVACALTLVFPLLMALRLLVAGGMAPGPGYSPMMRGFDSEAGVMAIAFGILAAPTLVMLVLLSSPTTNRFSIDALIFTPRPAPAFAVPAEPAPPTAEPDAAPIEGGRGPESPA